MNDVDRLAAVVGSKEWKKAKRAAKAASDAMRELSKHDGYERLWLGATLPANHPGNTDVSRLVLSSRGPMEGARKNLWEFSETVQDIEIQLKYTQRADKRSRE